MKVTNILMRRKQMKRILCLIMGIVMVLGLSACAKKEEKLEGSLEEILKKI